MHRRGEGGVYKVVGGGRGVDAQERMGGVYRVGGGRGVGRKEENVGFEGEGHGHWFGREVVTGMHTRF